MSINLRWVVLLIILSTVNISIAGYKLYNKYAYMPTHSSTVTSSVTDIVTISRLRYELKNCKELRDTFEVDYVEKTNKLETCKEERRRDKRLCQN